MTMRVKHKGLLVCAVVLSVVGWLFVAPAAKTSAAINPQINFQGKLTNPDGTNVADGTYSIVFSIYTVPTGGTAVWSETQSNVSVSSGNFQVALGSVNNTLTTAVDFTNSGLYLGVKVGSDAEMTPRIQFTSTPYSFNSDKLGGINASGFIQIGSGSVQNDATTNPSVFLNKTGASGNILELQKNGTDVVSINNSGATTFSNPITVQSNSYTANQVFLNDGLSSVLPAIPGSYLPALTIRVSQTAGSRPLFFGYDDTTGNGFASYLTAGACGSYSTMCLDFGTGTTTISALENSGTTLNIGGGDDGNFVNVQFKNTGSVIIGSGVADTTQVLLQPDSFSNFADTATCGTTTNQGAMYYNTATGSMRACINGNWEDLVSTGGLGLLAYGIVPDSSNAGSPGELAGITQANSPCKVYWSDATHVAVAPCYAYSGGRKVNVPLTTISTSTVAASRFTNVCLNSSGVPALVDTAGTTTDATALQPTWSANNPLLCLATLQMSTTAGTITNGKIYDTRTFTTTDKTFGTLNTAMNIGTIVTQSATANILGAPATTGSGPIRGVIISYSGAVSTTAANVIIAVNGPQWVKAAGTSTVAQFAEATATTGYTQSVTTVPTTGYSALGVDSRTIDTTCTSNATCQFSQFMNPLSLR